MIPKIPEQQPYPFKDAKHFRTKLAAYILFSVGGLVATLPIVFQAENNPSLLAENILNTINTAGDIVQIALR